MTTCVPQDRPGPLRDPLTDVEGGRNGQTVPFEILTVVHPRFGSGRVDLTDCPRSSDSLLPFDLLGSYYSFSDQVIGSESTFSSSSCRRGPRRVTDNTFGRCDTLLSRSICGTSRESDLRPCVVPGRL